MIASQYNHVFFNVFFSKIQVQLVKLKAIMNLGIMRILVVEDSPFNAFCITRLLQEANPALEVAVAKKQ